MAIYRAPLATKNFTQVPNHWLRDGNLSARAKGILSYICSHAPGYELTVKQMVAEMKDGQDAIYAGMKELEEAGYLVRQRQRAERGRLGGVDYTIVETPESDTSYSGSTRTGETKTGGTRSGGTKSGGSVTKNNNPKNTKDLESGSGVECLPSGRFAPSGPDDEDEDLPPLILEAPTTRPKNFTDWRAEDFDLLIAAIGSDHVISDGSVSPANTYPARTVYDALRKFPGDPKEWPGKYLATIAEHHPDGGVLNWLARFGLEPA